MERAALITGGAGYIGALACQELMLGAARRLHACAPPLHNRPRPAAQP
jgi:NAD(P)-dependent dehydrogenase (short-subunit alcohol dehydrogenase family)